MNPVSDRTGSEGNGIRASVHLSGSELFFRQPHHVEVGDAVFVIDGRYHCKSQAGIEILQIQLGRDPYRHAGMESRNPLHSLLHQVPGKPGSSKSRDHQQAADRWFSETAPGGQHPEVADYPPPVEIRFPGLQVQGAGIEAVGILVGAVLLDGEDFLADPEYFIQLFTIQLLER